MIDVYLDKNVLSHILTAQRSKSETNGVTPADIERLKEAIAAGKIRNLMSVMQIQEAAYALNAPSPEVANEELKLLRELLYQDEVIKFPNDLLFENVFNYAPLWVRHIKTERKRCWSSKGRTRRRRGLTSFRLIHTKRRGIVIHTRIMV